jgi:hypothetical protein
MNSTSSFNWAAIVIVALIAIGVGGGWLLFRRFAGQKAEAAYLWLSGTIVASIVTACFTDEHLRQPNTSLGSQPGAICAGIAIFLVVPLVLRLSGRWRRERTCAAGTVPIHPEWEWFGAGNVLCALAIAVLSWLGFMVPLALTLLVAFGAIAAYPLLFGGEARVTPAPSYDPLAAEREKVLALLVAEKITAEESADLLQALGATARSATAEPPRPLSSGQRLVLVGAAMVLLGFFLPWFVINPGEELSRLTGEIRFGAEVLEAPTLPKIATGSMQVSGGDIGRGMGWAALGFALVAALLPYFTRAMDAATQHMVRLLALGIGGVIVLYLLTQNIRFIGVGLVIAVAGYAVEWCGALRERRLG